MDDTRLETAIIVTVTYSSQFSYFLTIKEIYTRLLCSGCKENVPFTKVVNVVNSLVARGVLAKFDNYITWGNMTVSRAEKRQRAAAKWKEVELFVQVIGWLPWIQGIGVTGSLSVENTQQNDDVDFLLITRQNRLWLTRLVVSLVAFIAGKRRSWAREEANSWCFNLWLEPSQLEVDHKDVYRAYEVCQVQWVVSKNKMKERFLFANQWVKPLLPNFFVHQLRTPTFCYDAAVAEQLRIPLIAELMELLLSISNYCAYLLQRIYMLPHQTREVVALDMAFFHPRDTQKLVENGWERSTLEWKQWVLQQRSS